jgi:hypothetical protein
MTRMLEMMKGAITNALELESTAVSDAAIAYFNGKAMGVLEVAAGGALSCAEHAKLLEHYKSERERLF